MPPTIGAAIRRITSERARVPQDRQRTGHDRDHGHPLRPHARASRGHQVLAPPPPRRCARFQRVIQVDQHDYAGLRRHAGEGDEPGGREPDPQHGCYGAIMNIIMAGMTMGIHMATIMTSTSTCLCW